MQLVLAGQQGSQTTNVDLASAFAAVPVKTK
jgi:hypothetical protein